MTCPICNHDTTTTCDKCLTRIHRWLTEILDYHAIAETELHPGQTTGTPSSETPLGIRLTALDFVAGHDIHPILEEWERMFRNDFGETPLGPATLARNAGKASPATYLTGTIRYLTSHLPRIAEHDAITDFHNETRDLWKQAQAAARRLPEPSSRITCPADTGDGVCGTYLSVRTSDLDNTIRCRTCQSEWEPRWLIRVAIETPGARVWTDPEAAATWFGLTERTLRKWGDQGRIHRRDGRYELHSIHEAITASSA